MVNGDSRWGRGDLVNGDRMDADHTRTTSNQLNFQGFRSFLSTVRSQYSTRLGKARYRTGIYPGWSLLVAHFFASGTDHCWKRQWSVYGAGPRVPAQVQWLASRSSAENPHELRGSFSKRPLKAPSLQYKFPQVKGAVNQHLKILPSQSTQYMEPLQNQRASVLRAKHCALRRL